MRNRLDQDIVDDFQQRADLLHSRIINQMASVEVVNHRFFELEISNLQKRGEQFERFSQLDVFEAQRFHRIHQLVILVRVVVALNEETRAVPFSVAFVRQCLVHVVLGEVLIVRGLGQTKTRLFLAAHSGQHVVENVVVTFLLALADQTRLFQKILLDSEIYS